MAEQPLIFAPSSRSGSSVGAYNAKDTLAAATQQVTWHVWSDWLQRHTPPLLSDEAECAPEMQMQHLRFPTPPITPPRAIGLASGYGHAHGIGSFAAATHTDTAHTRTRSVIMKVGPGGHSPPQHISAPHLTTLEAHHLRRPVALVAAATSSESSSPSSDYVCEWQDCGRYFDSLESLAAHVTHIHAIASLNDGLYYCRWTSCPRTERGFNARYKMLVHVRTHTKEKPHQCHLCEKCFSRAENLKIHIRSHSGEKPYVCTYEGCHKAYSNSSDRFKHTRTHSMEKPYMCKVSGCQKRYTDPSSLRKHVKTFKHAVQLLHSAPNYASDNSNASVQRQLDISTAHSPHSSPLEEIAATQRQIDQQAATNTTYICLPHTPNGNYWQLGMVPEDMCHIKAGQLELECYYDTSKSATSATRYWSPADVASPSPLPLHNEDSAMELDVDVDVEATAEVLTYVDPEAPLDLRVRRS